MLTPDAAFMQMGIRKQELPLPPGQRNVMEAALKCDFLNVLQHASDRKYSFTATGNTTVCATSSKPTPPPSIRTT